MAFSTGPGGFRPEPGFEAEKDPKARGSFRRFAMESPEFSPSSRVFSRVVVRAEKPNMSKMIAHSRECARSCEMTMNDDE